MWASYNEIAEFNLTTEQRHAYKQNGRLDFSMAPEKPWVTVTGESGIVVGLLHILEPEFEREITINGKTYKVKDRACVVLAKEDLEIFFPTT